MAVTATNLTTGSSTSTSSMNTASISPAANSLILVTLLQEGDHPGSTPTLSGNGITWTQVNQEAVPIQNQFTMWRGSSASPSTGAITITLVGASGTMNSLWIVDQITGVDTTTNNGVVQTVGTSTNATVSSLAVTLSAFANIANATYGAMGLANANSITAGSNFTQVTQQNALSRQMQSQFAASNQTTVNWTFPSTGGDKDAIAIEIKAASSSGGGFIFNLI